MQIRKAPEKLSNTKLVKCDEIIKKLGDNGSFPIKIRPHSIYKKLATHRIFTEFALSNQILCKKLQEHFLNPPDSDSEPKPKGKPFDDAGLKSAVDSLQDKISYKSPTDNNLLKYLANALIYKAFLMDAKEQFPQDKKAKEYEQACKQEVGPENFERLKEQYKKVEECKKTRDDKRETLRENEDNLLKRENTWNVSKDNLRKYAKKPVPGSYETDLENYINAFTEYHDAEENNKVESTEETLRILNESEEKCKKSRGTFLRHISKEIIGKRAGHSYCKDAFENYGSYIKQDRKCAKLSTELKPSIEEYKEARKAYELIEGHESFTKYKHFEGGFARKYQKLDYKVSVHIRFARTMNALNAYTEGNFESVYGSNLPEEGPSDEYFWRKIKKDSIMKLERGKINRYVTVQDGGIYTSLADRSKVKGGEKHERTKFNYKNSTNTDDKTARPIWSINDKDNAEDTLEERIKKSCENFNEKIEDQVISTYASYYCADNVLMEESDGENTRLYLNYVYDPTEKKMEIPCSIEDEKKEKKAPLHIMTPDYSGGKTHDLSIDNEFTYKRTELVKREQIDMAGLLYAIRKEKIAVSPMENGFHSSMWSGKKVQTAGVLAAWNGKLIAVDNQSGHYMPNWYLMYMAWKPFYKENGQSVFHEQAIVGIAVPISTGPGASKCYDQFFNIKEFMDLAKEDFEIGATAKELIGYINRLDGMRSESGGFKMTDQSQSNECANVLKAIHLYRYSKMVWPDRDIVNEIAYEFIDMLYCNFKDKILTNIKNAYNLFPDKKRLFSRNKGRIEYLFKYRTEKLKAAIKKTNNRDLKQRQIKRKDELIEATKKYKKVFSEIGIKPAPDHENRLRLIDCTFDIYEKNKAYSELVKEVLEGSSNKNIKKCQDKIDAWVKLIEPLIKAKADRTAGLSLEQKNKERLTHSMLSFEDGEENKDNQGGEDNLANGEDTTSEIESTVKPKLLHLVDTSSIPKTPSAQTPQIQPTAQPQQQQKKPPPVPKKDNRPPSKKTPTQQKRQTPTQSTAQPKQQQPSTQPTAQPKRQPPKQQQQPKKTRGAPFKCINGHEAYFGGICTRCGKQLESV